MGSDAFGKYRSPRTIRSPYKHGSGGWSHSTMLGLPLKYIAGMFFLCMMGTTLYVASVSGKIEKVAVTKDATGEKAGVHQAVGNTVGATTRNLQKSKTKPRLGSPQEDANTNNAKEKQPIVSDGHNKPPQKLSPAEVVKQEPDKENLPVMAGHVDTPQHDESGEHMQLVSSIPKRRDGQWDNRWEVSHKLPEWAKDYFANWREYKYLVLTCFKGQVCGNVSHRLRPLAGLIRLAYDTNRVLMIQWDAPDSLDKYVEPPTHGGIEWRVPEYMQHELKHNAAKNQQSDMQMIVTEAANKENIIVCTRYNNEQFAEPYYNDKIADNEGTADTVFHDIWGVLFKPTFQLRERVTETLEVDNGLKPGEYASVHIEYEKKTETEEEQKDLRAKVENAMNCMSHLRPGGPFLVAAQTKEIAQEAVDYGEAHNVTIVATVVAHDGSDLPLDLHQSFTEIYYMANTRCVAYGSNGYGQLGYLLGFNHDCRVKYSGERAEQCEWQDAPTNDLHLGHSHLLNIPTKEEIQELHSDKNVGMDKITPRKPHEDHGARWEHAPNLPEWSKDYFEWHERQLIKMSPTNWQNFRFLVMTCLDAQRCGNVVHRLRPIAGMMRLAYDSNRLLMIHWEKPDLLEHFLEPPRHGGLNWTVPDYMMETLHKTGQQNNMKLLEEAAKSKDNKLIINAKYNDDEFAEPYYNDNAQSNEVFAEKAFHDIWHVLFKPTFTLKERITEALHGLGIKEGLYSTVHIEYEKEPKNDEETKQLREKVKNAMNCLTEIQPEGPYLVAAQTYAIAKEAMDYGKEKRAHVVTRQIAHDTSDLPDDLTNSMVEIYLMANTKCVAYGRNGYGQLGYMLGFDHDCAIQYRGEDGHQRTCEWKGTKAGAVVEVKKAE